MTKHLFAKGPRSLAAFAGAFCLLLGSSAVAAVYIYNNDFESKSRFEELKTAKGKACDESYNKEQRVVRVAVQKDDYCGIKTPVTSDADQPNHEIIAQGRVLKTTPKAARKPAYLAVRARAGSGGYYEFRISPKTEKYRLKREPSVGGLPLAGLSGDIKGMGKLNKLRLRINDGQVTAFVNDQIVANFVDPNPGQVEGRSLSFGIGSTQSRDDGPKGTFRRVRVGVPNP